MIHKKDLRYGNLIALSHESNAPIVTVAQIKNRGVVWEVDGENGYSGFELLMPIELTTEWMEKLGFIYSDGTSEYGTYRNNYVEIYEHDEEPGIFHFSMGLFRGHKREIKSVHQLQNLYYFLTEEELTIKDTNGAQRR